MDRRPGNRQRIDPFSGRMLLLLYASGLMFVVSLSIAAAVVGTGWSWSVLIVGVIVAAAVTGLQHLTLRFALSRMVARVDADGERVARARQELRKRARIYPVLFAIAFGVAILGAALETYWPALLVLVVAVLTVVVIPLAALPFIIRRVERRRDGQRT